MGGSDKCQLTGRLRTGNPSSVLDETPEQPAVTLDALVMIPTVVREWKGTTLGAGIPRSWPALKR